ncbi:MAG: hypothetical protein PHC88_12910 [Terrimicrobiaceae bacterium]|nr:hypothetical protein [Terrimicrobiaceae bacterium]
MKAPARATLCAFAIAFGCPMLRANPPVIIFQPVQPMTVVSPLTTGSAASNQILLNQISGTLIQRRTEHEILTTNALLQNQGPALRNQPPVLRQR